MDNKSLKFYRENLNKKKGRQNYKIDYKDNILINNEFKNLLNLSSNDISLLNFYSSVIKFLNINKQKNMNKLKNIIGIDKDEGVDELIILLNINRILINHNDSHFCN